MIGNDLELNSKKNNRIKCCTVLINKSDFTF